MIVFRRGGNVEHSAVITSPGMVTMAAGVDLFPDASGNLTQKFVTVPIEKAWNRPNSTIEYWRQAK
jgi:hypothetical protein